jgi:predicted Zn-dependent protease with MMP-like domain
LLGLYHGTPLTERGVEHHARLPDRITIYQRNIERICRTPAQIVQQVRKTVLHEVGHHFGMDESALEEMGYQ